MEAWASGSFEPSVPLSISGPVPSSLVSSNASGLQIQVPVADFTGTASYLVGRYFSYYVNVSIAQAQVAKLQALGTSTTPVPVDATLTVGDVQVPITGTCLGAKASAVSCTFANISLATLNPEIPSYYHQAFFWAPTVTANATFTAQ